VSEQASSEQEPGASGRHWVKPAVVVATIVAVALAIRFTGIAEYATIGRLRAFRDAAGLSAPFLFVLLYIAGTVVAFPGAILSLIGGLLFGTLLGGFYIVIGATIGAVGAFLVARYAGRETTERLIAGSILERFDKSIHGAGFWSVFFTRAMPIFPFVIVNYAWGLTSVRLRDYALGTAVGIIPTTFILANLAGAVARSLEGTDASLVSIDVTRLFNADVFFALALLGVLAMVVPAVRAVARKRGG
jgi:uncharacterized membrane protein YdjX (TVP38/TMEM64 family)